MHLEDLPNIAPFHTLDAIDGIRTTALLKALKSSHAGDDEPLAEICSNDVLMKQRLANESIKSVSDRNDIPWDDATLLWMAITQTNKDGKPIPLDKGRAREGVGRLHWGDGSPVSYLLEHIIEEVDSGLVQLLQKLNYGLSESEVGHNRFDEGFAGLSLRGWLSENEVIQLRGILLHTSWGVAADEPFDGGVRHVVKHLVIILRSARSRGFGIMLRKHA